MAELITTVPGTRMLIGPDWELRADRVDDPGDGGGSAVPGIRRGLKLLLTRSASAAEADVEAWAGGPGQPEPVPFLDPPAGHLPVPPAPPRAPEVRRCGD